MKLISMTDFVLEKSKNAPLEDYNQVNETFVNKVINYANFLKQPLKLEMFVPCDDEGNVLDCKEWKQFEGKVTDLSFILEKHKKAKEKVLFEGFQANGIQEGYWCVELTNTDNWIIFHNNTVILENEFGEEICLYTVECLINLDITIAQSALKKIGLCQ